MCTSKIQNTRSRVLPSQPQKIKIEKKKTLHLTKNDPPKTPIITSNLPNPVLPGSDLRLSCNTDSPPANRFTWYMGGLEMGQSTRDFHVANIQAYHSAVFTCRAYIERPSGRVGSELSLPYEVTVAGACSSSQFTCSSLNTDNTPQCVASSSRCDGTNHCTDGSDEAGCTCSSSQYTCIRPNTDYTPQCVASSARCDGTNHCTDGSDEAGCGTSPGSIKVDVTLTLDYKPTNFDLVSPIFKEFVKIAIVSKLKRSSTSITSVTITGLRRGSLIVDFTIEAPSSKGTAHISIALDYLAQQPLFIYGKKANVLSVKTSTDPPSISSSPNSKRIKSGTKTTFVCDAKTRPGDTVMYHFIKDPNFLKASTASNTYTMTGNPNRNGVYSCSVTVNGVPSIPSAGIERVFTYGRVADKVSPVPVSPYAVDPVTQDTPSTPVPDPAPEEQEEEEDTWELSVKTSKAWYSGSGANIFIQLSGDQGTSQLIDVGKIGKSRGDSDTLTFSTNATIGQLEFVVISHDGTKKKSNWKLEQFYVKNVANPSNMISPSPDTWIRPEEKLMCDTEDCQIVKGTTNKWTERWEVRIRTSDQYRKSGTSSRVYVQLSGTEGSTATVRLDPDSGKFTKGGDDTFSIKTQAVGDLNKVSFSLDERGDNWNIWRFSVTSTETGAVVFEAEPLEWLDNGQRLECTAEGCHVTSH